MTIQNTEPKPECVDSLERNQELFRHEELERYADVLLWAVERSRGRPLKTSETVLIEYDGLARTLAEVLYARILERGLVPVQHQRASPTMEQNYLVWANNKRLNMVAPGDWERQGGVNGLIRILAPESLTHLEKITPEIQTRRDAARDPLREMLYFRELSGQVGRTVAVYPTLALAEAAGVSLSEYAARVRTACMLGSDDPVRDWKRFATEQAPVLEWLNAMPIQGLHIQSARVDLRLRLGERRVWLGMTGRNMPSYEIYTSPDCRFTEGVFQADQVVYVGGVPVEDVRLAFQQGRVISVKARQGAERLRRFLALDEGAWRIGEFSLTSRTHSRITGYMANTLFDENIGGIEGNCHIALGSCHPDAFAGNPADFVHALRRELGFNESTQHWDLVNTEQRQVAAILTDGSRRVIYEDGDFTA
ncbi:aminopeptidase [Desulfonatronum thioautotrophicum]|uniref:aminopeptidase n=1 Tax=Desulfonatronum thioautotrophicum TaxID=617001 RepID=UPI00069C802E|nr:aminopeptidase [Desulfonatronum thioautotrophicum]